jgi:hypothetical protein
MASTTRKPPSRIDKLEAETRELHDAAADLTKRLRRLLAQLDVELPGRPAPRPDLTLVQDHEDA